MTIQNVNSWLRRVPHPKALRLDAKKTVLIGDGKTKWRDVVNTLEQLQPGLVEALDDEGRVLRVMRCDRDDGSTATQDDNEARERIKDNRDVEIATVIMEAGDRGARRHAEAYQLAFGKMTELVQILADRLTGLEHAWQTALNQRADDVAAQGDADKGDGGIVGNLLQLAMSKDANASAATAGKGKAK